MVINHFLVSSCKCTEKGLGSIPLGVEGEARALLERVEKQM